MSHGRGLYYHLIVSVCFYLPGVVPERDTDSGASPAPDQTHCDTWQAADFNRLHASRIVDVNGADLGVSGEPREKTGHIAGIN